VSPRRDVDRARAARRASRGGGRALDLTGVAPVPGPCGPIEAVIFDKDGTLFDFQGTWAPWTDRILMHLAGGAPERVDRLARAIGFDRRRARFAPESPAVAGTPDDAARCLAPLLPAWDRARLAAFLAKQAETARPVPPVPLAPVLDRLLADGLRLAVMTNDATGAARAQLDQAGVSDRFAHILGSDSGHGAKPDPGPLLYLGSALGLPPGRILVVGDSRHDLDAAQAAGMPALAVLTGPADAATLARGSAAVLPHIGVLPDWLAARRWRPPATGSPAAPA
jgi:phosphoglycolate phosphatase